MKKTALLLLIFLAINFTINAQAPQGFNYQAIARNSAGTPLISQSVGIQIGLLQGSATGTNVYTELHTVVSNNIGLINVVVGAGTVQSGTFNSIDWSAGPYFLEISMITSGSPLTLMGTQQLMSVPYALYSANGGSGSQGATGATGTAGTNGIDGSTGATGAVGATGTAGTNGSIGATGVVPALTNAHVFVGNGSNVATDVALSGDATISNLGAVTLTNGSPTRTNLGLGNLDNTSDLNKPMSTATQAALDLKANLISPSFTTPILGVATATTINKVTITEPVASSTLTIADGKTFTANNTLTFVGTDATTMTFPSVSSNMSLHTASAALTSAPIVPVDFGIRNIYTYTPAEDGTLDATGGGIPGGYYSIIIATSGTTEYILTFGTAFKTIGLLATGTVDLKVFVITFVYDGTNFNEVARTIAM